jgi:hypothetical protein
MPDLTFDHSAVVSRDMDADVDFYLQLGFTVETRYDDWAMLRDARGRGLALLSPSGNHPPHFALRAPSRRFIEQISQQHSERVLEHRDGSASIYIRDPSGNCVEMIVYPEDEEEGY